MVKCYSILYKPQQQKSTAVGDLVLSLEAIAGKFRAVAALLALRPAQPTYL